jgi:acyl carrier protein
VGNALLGRLRATFARLCQLRDKRQAVINPKNAQELWLETMTSSTRATLEEIFRIVLQLDDGRDVSSVRRITEPRWDSLAHTSIVAAIESEFSVRLDIKDDARITSFEAAEILLEEKGF